MPQRFTSGAARVRLRRSEAKRRRNDGWASHKPLSWASETRTNFTDVVPQKRRLLLTLNMRFDEISDPRGLAADVTNLGLWGNGDVQLEVDKARQIPYAMELVRQAFTAKQPDGAKGSEG